MAVVRLPVGLAVVLIATAACLFAGEMYVRAKASHVVAQRETLLHRLGFVEQNPELLMRYTDRGRRLIPGARVVIKNHYLSHQDIPIEINASGFRGKEISVDRTPGVPRILILGDSITWGDYLRDDDTYVRETERRLEAAVGRPVEVINAGVGDTGSEEQLDLLEESGLRLRPDLVVLGFYLNDSRPPWGFPGELSGRGWLRRHSLLVDRVYERLVFFGWLQRQGADRFAWIAASSRLDWKNDPTAFAELARLARYDWGAAWTEGSWTTVDRQLARLEENARRHRFTVVTLTFPVMFQVQATRPDASPQMRFGELSRRHGFTNLDLLPLFRAHAHEDIFFDQCHPKAGMNRIVGDALATFLLPDVRRLLEARALENGQPRVPREARIPLAEAAAPERRAARRDDGAGVHTPGAEPGRWVGQPRVHGRPGTPSNSR